MAPRRRKAIVARRERPEAVRVWRVRPASLLRWGGAALREGSKRTTTSTATHLPLIFCHDGGLIEKLSRMGASARPRVRL